MAGRLPHMALDAVGRVLTLHAARGNCPERFVGIRRVAPHQRRLNQALRDKVRETSIGGGRVAVVVNRETKVIRGRLIRLLDDVLAAAEQLDDAEREIGKAIGIEAALCEQPLLERPTVRCRRQLSPRFRGQRDNAQPAFRHAHDAAQRPEPPRLEKLRRAGVGGDHEILDQL